MLGALLREASDGTADAFVPGTQSSRDTAQSTGLADVVIVSTTTHELPEALEVVAAQQLQRDWLVCVVTPDLAPAAALLAVLLGRDIAWFVSHPQVTLDVEAGTERLHVTIRANPAHTTARARARAFYAALGFHVVDNASEEVSSQPLNTGVSLEPKAQSGLLSEPPAPESVSSVGTHELPELTSTREQIEGVDMEILRCLERRAQLAKRAAELKSLAGYRPRDLEREAAILRSCRDWGRAAGMDADTVEGVFRLILRLTRPAELRSKRS
jgi:chorismate mutase